MLRDGISAGDRDAVSPAASRQTGEERMRFQSILFPDGGEPAPEAMRQAPACFHDLNLDQIVAAVSAGWRDHDPAPYFHVRLTDADAIAYRQEVMRDLENEELRRAVQAFCDGLRTMREYLPDEKEHYYKYERERWFLSAVEVYCRAVERFGQELRRLEPKSRGLRDFGEYLTAYAASDALRRLAAGADKLVAALSIIRYNVHLEDGVVTVRPYDNEPDYSAVVERLFEKFRHGAVNDYRASFPRAGGMNHIEAQILERVALLFPEVFQALEAYHAEQAAYLDARIARFDREIQFYLAYLRYIEKFRRAGLPFCYPRVSRASKEIRVRETFDIALADKLVNANMPVVCNDFFLQGPERLFVVTGPNHGGKTTFARIFGQLHYLACLGCPVPGTEARLYLYDQLFTHFEREEDIETLRGKLQDDLYRMRWILERATSDSIVILNEIFSSTTLQDAVYLGKKIMERISALDLLGVCVTFLDELASFNEKTVSIVSTVDPDNPAIRTYKLVRRPADGLAYALAIAEKYRVTYDQLKERIKP
jgi:DNA mismatch repair protein MutS